MIEFIKTKMGLILCLSSLFIYCLITLPLSLSVVCANENQGFAFTFGQNLLLYHELASGRGPLFVLLYAIVLKIFGFNTYSIIFVHFIGTFLLFSVGLLIYFTVSKILNNNLFAGLAVLFWVFMISTPIGMSDLVVEIRSQYNLNEENLCVFFSLISLFCLVLSASKKIFPFLAGLFAVFSLMSKASGSVLLIATILWFFLLFFLRKEDFKVLRKNIVFYFSGVLISLLIFNFILYMLCDDLFLLWKDYFLLGNYTHDYSVTPKIFLNSLFDFLTRYTHSFSNFILFFIVFLLYIFGLIKGCLKGSNGLAKYWLLVSFWGLGNVCVIMVPRVYQPYYYQLIWASVSVVFSFGLYELFLKKINKRLIRIFICILIFIFFLQRIITVVPAYCKFTNDLRELSISNQPQSFQDPVLSYDHRLAKRPGFLQLADEINLLLPDKAGTFYIFNFNEGGHTGFTPLSYIYAKRAPTTSVDSALLRVNTIVESKLRVLKKELIKRPPDILVISKNNYLSPWQIEIFNPYLKWFGDFTRENYHFETTLDYIQAFDNNKIEIFYIYRKNNI